MDELALLRIMSPVPLEHLLLFFVFSLLAAAVPFWPAFLFGLWLLRGSRDRLAVSSALAGLMAFGINYVNIEIGRSRVHWEELEPWILAASAIWAIATFTVGASMRRAPPESAP